MADSYTFKVFTGPHNGLVFDLKPGSYKVGTGTDNDLIFSDEEMGSSAAVIEVTPFEVNITVNDPAQIDGQPLEPGQHKWDSGVFILLGDTLICYRASSVKGPWAKPSFTSEQPAAEVPKTGTEGAEGLENPPTEGGEANVADAAVSAESETVTEGSVQKVEAQSPALAESVDKRTIALTAASALLLILLLVFLMFGSTIFKSSDLDTDLEALNTVIKENNFKDLKTEVNDDIIDLNGSVESKVRFAKLIEVLPELKTTLNLNVEVRDDEILGVERDFLNLGYYVHAHYIDDGKIGVDGYMADAYVEAEAFNAMDSRYKNRLKGRIVYRSELENELKDNCEHLGVHNIQLVLGKGRVFYKGRTTLDDQNALETARYKTSKKLGIPLMLTEYDPKASSSVERLDGTETIELSASTDERITSLSERSAEERKKKASEQNVDETAILSVTMKPMRFITLKNGRKYFEGGVLPSGYVVSSIDLNKVILIKGNEVKELQLK
ncbi:type III secretion system inner membrane ring subunit SctD [uncultured Succinivibrio sp.]|uniref:type III secretion system inner membrane ring subunit SctD n=1 Tax=uncultured Succinivibrio sp. TaxID=540749 RepID=UPI0025F72D0D|nr:type III secretion system inner membrane ring subunit SctD [uncultured Succinivibrio sp.]